MQLHSWPALLAFAHELDYELKNFTAENTYCLSGAYSI